MAKNNIQLRCGKTILASQEAIIDKLLTELIAKAPAKLTLLIDTSGQVISFNGDRGSIDLVALGALVAADLAASQEIARLANLYQENQMILRQGSKMNTIIHEVGKDMVLLVMVSSSIPLGWFSYIVRHTAQQIDQIVQTTGTKVEMATLDTDKELLAKELSNALDNIWNG